MCLSGHMIKKLFDASISLRHGLPYSRNLFRILKIKRCKRENLVIADLKYQH